MEIIWYGENEEGVCISIMQSTVYTILCLQFIYTFLETAGEGSEWVDKRKVEDKSGEGNSHKVSYTACLNLSNEIDWCSSLGRWRRGWGYISLQQ